jgi:hypothetical protein
MTEATGRGTGWGTLAVVAPAAAVALAAATGWAIANPPLTPDAPAAAAGPAGAADDLSPDQGPGSAVDKPLVRLEREALAERARVVRLEKRLHRINARTSAVARTPLPPAAGSSRAGSVAAPPRVAPVPAPNPAPPTHTSTGAS